MAVRRFPERVWALIFVGNPPERQLFPTPQHFDDAIRRIIQTGLVRGWRAIPFGILMGVGFSMPMFLLDHFGFIGARNPFFTTALGAMVFGILGCLPTFVVMTLFLRRVGRKRIRRELIGIGVPVCMTCGYCLRGVESARCPECGWVLDPQIARVLARERSD